MNSAPACASQQQASRFGTPAGDAWRRGVRSTHAKSDKHACQIMCLHVMLGQAQTAHSTSRPGAGFGSGPTLCASVHARQVLRLHAGSAAAEPRGGLACRRRVQHAHATQDTHACINDKDTTHSRTRQKCQRPETPATHLHARSRSHTCTHAHAHAHTPHTRAALTCAAGRAGC